jgi:hypothetical protein
MLVVLGNVIFVTAMLVLARCEYKLEKANEEREKKRA